MGPSDSMRARVAALCLLAPLAAAGPAAAQTEPPAHVVCRGLYESAGYANRFEVLRAMVKLVACNLNGHVADAEMHDLVAPRMKTYAANCFDPQERAYVRHVLRGGALQEIPHAGEDVCDQTFDRIRAMALPGATP